MLEIGIIPFQNTFEKGFRNTNPIAIMEKVDNFDRLVLPIRFIPIETDPDVGNIIILDL